MNTAPHPSSLISRPSNRIEVAAAVIIRPDGSFLLGQRPAGKVYAGYWEFPGGKVEPGELPLTALTRELHEELGIDVELAYPWLTRDYDYEHAAVRLRFFRVVRWSGTPTGRENQTFSWQSPAAVSVTPLLPANAPIMRALRLAPVYGITHAGDFGPGVFLPRLEKALREGLRLVQVREKWMPEKELAAFLAQVLRLARGHGARVLLNGSAQMAQQAGADGVHLTARQLMALDRRPALELVGASCHNEEELARAVSAEADFVVLGPVRPTPSHPDTPAMGWSRFGRLIEDYPSPVYALGGLTRSDMETAWRAGAHGISMMRGAWPPAA
ncbi:MAG TPA: Nudix family hydrolase [Burkholderiales bacterium]|nr:Nudix family hydrolase [Burkholderiales bacterium]